MTKNYMVTNMMAHLRSNFSKNYNYNFKAHKKNGQHKSKPKCSQEQLKKHHHFAKLTSMKTSHFW